MNALHPLPPLAVLSVSSSAWLGLASFVPALGGILLVRHKLARRLLLLAALTVTAWLWLCRAG